MYVFILTYKLNFTLLKNILYQPQTQKFIMSEKNSDFSLQAFFRSVNLDKEAALIVEDILREEVFHSTLDWQTSEQLLGGVIRAHDLFLRDEAFLRASARHSKALH